jgi:hypothetical protein
MAYATNSIMARIAWCLRQRKHARGQRESEEWHAEEEGLRDALYNQDHSNRYQSSSHGLFMRYAIGLQDGCTLLRTGAMRQQFKFFGKGTKATHVVT